MNPNIIVALLLVAVGVLMEAVSPANKYHTAISSIGVSVIFFGAFLLGTQIGR